ncbi:MAG: phosphopantetheine-binding protein [Pseudomonadota bacterium]
MTTLETIRAELRTVLQLGPEFDDSSASTPLLGSIPELDSMAVVSILTAFEDVFDIEIEDDDIDAETFATLGSLAEFVDQKRAA